MAKHQIMGAALLSAFALAACDSADTARTDVANDASPSAANAPVVPAEDGAAPPPAATGTGASKPSATGDRWAAMAGKWVGPEGLVATITPKAGSELFDVDLVWGLDANMRGTFVGTPVEHGIVITRDGKQEILRQATGEFTGMKWLADKRDCLVLVEGEQAWCRE